jgi:ABC-type transporter Mla subunit MlaD
MWKELAATGPLKTTDPAAAQPVTEEELASIFDRLDTARDIFRQNRDLREALSRLETETRKLRIRDAELEEILRKFAPMLLDVATTMGLAAKNEEPDTSSQPENPQFVPQ